MKRTLIKLPVIPEESKQTHTNKNNQKFGLGGFGEIYPTVLLRLK